MNLASKVSAIILDAGAVRMPAPASLTPAL
jgi:hypothetical protein